MVYENEYFIGILKCYFSSALCPRKLFYIQLAINASLDFDTVLVSLAFMKRTSITMEKYRRNVNIF